MSDLWDEAQQAVEETASRAVENAGRAADDPDFARRVAEAAAEEVAREAARALGGPAAAPAEALGEASRALGEQLGQTDAGQAAAEAAREAARRAAEHLPSVPSVPDVPELPEVPELPSAPYLPPTPQLPAVPDLSALPQVPGMPDVPAIPEMPDVPELPDVPSLADVPAVPPVPDVPELEHLPSPPGVPTPAGLPAVPQAPSFAAAAAPAAPAPRARQTARPTGGAGGASGGGNVAGGGPAGSSGDSAQAARSLRVSTTLGEDVFLLTRLRGEEGVSRPFAFTLDLDAEEGAVAGDAAATLLGTPVRAEIAAGPDGARVLHGRVRRFRRVGGGTARTRYQLEMVPWLWMLSLSADCRIFQKKSVPDILTEVFQDLGFSDYKLRLVRPYEPREFCVQYRESHLDFVSRLMEEEGIFYYFQHEADRHTLVLGDGAAAVGKDPMLPAIRPATEAGVWADSLHTVYSAFEVERVMHPAKVTLADYNYLTPSVSLETSLAAHGGTGEVFDYPGKYEAAGEGNRYVRLRVEEAEAERERAEGTSSAPGLVSGASVGVEGTGDDRDWFVLRVEHDATQGTGVAGGEGEFKYENTFAAVPADTPWRPPLDTPRPRVRGTQSALVVGPAGSEIYTDAHGRVKLHFYWDRRSRKDENSSCWVRCSTAWAGKGWGQFSVPRLGQEVLVDFLEGDPDRPVVVGRVYNADQPPPCDPGGSGGAVSGMRSKSHRGEGYNGIEMYDAAGAEKLDIHAQYDMNTVVGNNDTQSVGVDRTIDVGGKHTETIKADTSITVTGGPYSLDVAGGTSTTHVSGAVTESFDATQETTVASDITITSSGGAVAVTASSEITLTVGASSLTMTSGGDITLKGVTLLIDGTQIDIAGKAKVAAAVSSSSLTLTPASSDLAGPLINSSATGIHSITGATVKLN